MSKLAVVGNVSVDSVDDAPPSAGGCPSFAALGMRMLGSDGQIVTRFAERDYALFEPLLSDFDLPVVVLSAATTSGFGLRYHGEQRTMTVDSIGDPWTPTDVAAVDPDASWIHVAPLLRSDFPPETLAALAAGRRVSYDGQGLVRVPSIGELRTDAAFDPRLLESLTVLKLAEDEASVIATGPFDLDKAEALGVPEILLTRGSEGSVVFSDGAAVHVPSAWPVLGIQTTGAGDVFMVGYAAGRSGGADPVAAAELASELVARMLEERKAAMSGR